MIRNTFLSFVFLAVSVFAVCSVTGQDEVRAPVSARTGSIAEDPGSKATPVAVPVYSPEKAKKANEEAASFLRHKDEKSIWPGLKKGLKSVLKCTLFVALAIAIAVLLFRFRKKIRKYHAVLYGSPFGRLFYVTRFCKWDCLGILLVFTLSVFFSALAGHKEMLKGNIGYWFADNAGQKAISIYNRGDMYGIVTEPGSKLDDFLKKGSRGDLQYADIADEDAVPKEYRGKVKYLESSGIAWMLALWWKLVGHPNWSTVYILFSLFYGLICVAAYCVLRQVAGLVPSVFLGLLLSAFPTMMYQVMFVFRDGARALFVFAAIAVFLYLLKGAMNWKGTISSSIVLFIICSLTNMFRNDFIVILPFILVATVFFHGKLLSDYRKKTVIVLSIVLGLVVAVYLPGKNRYPKDEASGHVLYIGLADHPYMDKLQLSSNNYAKAVAYSDYFGFKVGAGRAYRTKGKINVQGYSKDYDEELKGEIFNLMTMYPYDFLRLGLSSSIQCFNVGSRMAAIKYTNGIIESAPGYHLFQKKSKRFYQDVSPKLYFVFLCASILLFLFGDFPKCVVPCLAFMAISGCYLFQFDIRHYFYLLILSLVVAGFATNRLIRIYFITVKSPKRLWKVWFHRRKRILFNCVLLAVLVGLGLLILLGARIVQEKQIMTEIAVFGREKTETVDFRTETIDSSLKPAISAVDVQFNDFYSKYLPQVNEKQNDFAEFIKVQFEVTGADPSQNVCVFTKYKDVTGYTFNPTGVITRTKTCPVPLTFKAAPGTNTLYFPVYFSRNIYPMTGIEIHADGKPVVVHSVERISDAKNIRTQSAFLVPSQMDNMRYAGEMAWSKALWAE